MPDEPKAILPSPDNLETAYDIAAAVSSMVPWIGGPISSVLAGVATSLRMDRVREVLIDLGERISDLDSEISREYVKTDEFAELLDRTLRQAANERSEEKRKAYAAFLEGDIASPGNPYDEKIRVLRTLEEMQPDHLRVLAALDAAPDPNYGMMGSVGQTLRKRLPGINPDRIADLAQQLTDMRLATLQNLNTMMTGRGSEELQALITPYGRRFLTYIKGRS
jgi:hypothetical protein